MSILFVNGSPNRDGNTAALAKTLIGGRPYTTLNLNDYRINFYGQELSGDQFDEVAAAMRGADTLVIGSPLYWHNLSGALRTLLDHFYGGADTAAFSGKDMYFICQGAAPEQWMLEACEYTMKRFASYYDMNYRGTVTNRREAERLAAGLR